MRVIRRTLQVVALVGTLLVGVVAVTLIVSQTPWFKDWLRRYIVRESHQFLAGDLTIGRLGGNLFFGVTLADVAVDVSGERVVAMHGVEVDYSVFDFISRGIIINEIQLHQPVVRAQRDADGWNLGRLILKQEREADREGPARPIAFESIVITDGLLTIDDRAPADGYRLPSRIEGLDLRAAFNYEPVHYTVDIDHLGFRGSDPELSLQQLSGTIAVRDDNLYLDEIAVRLTDTAMTIDGVIEHYLSAQVVGLTTTGHVSLAEIARIVPAAAGYPLTPAFDVRAEGPLDRMALTLDVRSEAGNVTGEVTADAQAPDFALRGDLDVQNLDLAPLLQDPAQRSNITGEAKVDLRLASGPENVPPIDRMAGTFQFAGPRVVAAGYDLRAVRATGTLDGSRINLDGRAAAYGGTATARGFIVTPAAGRPLSFDLRGAASNVDLRALPAATGAPRLVTRLSASEYHVQGAGDNISGSAQLNESTVEGATLAQGTTADFSVTPATVSYSARGSVSALDLERLGRALEIEALAGPEYASRLSGDFDVTGSMPRTEPASRRGSAGEEPNALATMTLTASGTLRESELFGGRLPELTFATTLDRGALEVRGNGRFEGFNPARFAERPELEGRVSGSLDVTAAVADITAPITPDAVRAEGTVTLTPSEIGGLEIESADVQGRYAGQVGELTRLTLAGPDVKIDASGPIALDRQSQSALKYRVDVLDLAALGRLAGQEGLDGVAALEGTITGNAAELTINGTLEGGNLAYEDNNALSLASRYTVTLPELHMAEARVEATTEATFVTAGGLEINSVNATTTYAGERLDFEATLREQAREFDAAGQVIFHPDHQEVHLPTLALRTQGVEWRSAPGSEAAIKYGGGQVEIEDLRLVSADQSLDVNGTVVLGGGEEQPEAPATGQLRVAARNVDLQQLETLLLRDTGITGRLSADVTLSGSIADPAVDGRVEVQNGGFQDYRYNSLVATIDYGSDRIGIDATLQQSPTEALTAKGTVPLTLFRPAPGGHVTPTGADEVDLHVTTTSIDLGFVQGMTTAIANVTGTLQADVRVTGSGQDPHVVGYIDIRGGAFGVPLGGVSYTGLNTRIELAEDVARIQKFDILDEHGQPLTIAGELAVHAKQVGAVNITVESDNFEVIDNELGDIGVDSQLRITGELRRPRIEGDVRLQAGRLEVDRLLQAFYDPYAIDELPDVISADRAVAQLGTAEDATREALARARESATPAGTGAAAGGVEPPAPASLMDPLELEIRVRIPDNLVLRGSDLRPGGPTGTSLGDMNITVGGDVRVLKRPGEAITILGIVNTVRGTYEFQGRRFALQRGGTVRFIGTPEINPLLDITAVRLIPNTGVEARVRITGTPAAPELHLSSDPSLPESDILSLIVFNRQVNELGTGERSSLAATAGGIATGFIAAPLGESIGRALDLDLFEITTTTESGELGAGVTVGQQIGDRAFLKLRQEFGQRSMSEFILEYQLYDFLRLRATAAPESTGAGNRINQRRVERGGIDLIFFFSY